MVCGWTLWEWGGRVEVGKGGNIGISEKKLWYIYTMEYYAAERKK